jgi:hypothetical protein
MNSANMPQRQPFSMHLTQAQWATHKPAGIRMWKSSKVITPDLTAFMRTGRVSVPQALKLDAVRGATTLALIQAGSSDSGTFGD